jgi:hypothetical protein
MVSGGLLVAVGLPLSVVGSGKNPRKDQASPVAPAPQAEKRSFAVVDSAEPRSTWR